MRQLPSFGFTAALPLALAACGGGAENNVAGNDAQVGPANVAGPAFSGPAPVAGVTREFLIGSWATDSCDVPSATYAADGSMAGGRRWQLEGDRLIVTGGAMREQSVVERLGEDRMRLNTADGPFELHRCPAPQR